MATEFVGIQLELLGADGVKRDLQNLDKLLDSLGGRKKFDAGFNEAKNQVVQYRGELEKLKREQAKLEKGSDEWNDKASEIENVKNKLRDAQQAVREFGRASQQAGKTFMQTFNSISSRIAHIGSAMQSFGNAVTRLASPFSRLMDGVVLGAGFKVLNSFTEGFERGFTRYDTMKKYPKIMAAFGYSAAESEKSIKALDLSVRGLPTGLDEMVDLAQRFIATTGDMDKGTKLAIATNNAFLASMSTDTQRYQGMMQLQDVLGGKDMNAREWNSLVSSMTPAIVKMGEAMKESGKWSGSIGDFIQHVRDGKMDNQEFINQLIAIGNKGGSLEKMAQESKNTWQAFFANVGNAASRMTAGIIESMDEIVKSLNLTDKNGVAIDSVNMLLSQKFIPAIDNTTKSIKKWIKAHPEEIKQFFKDLSKIDFKSLARGFAQGLGDLAKILHTTAKLLGGKDLSLIGRFFGNGRFIGWASTIGGGLLKGTRHIFAIIGIVGRFLGSKGGKLLAGKFGGKLGSVGIFGKIASFFGKKKDIEEVGEVGKAVTKASPNLVKAFKNMALLSGIVGMPVLTGWGITKGVKASVKNFKDTINLLKGIDWDDAKKLLAGISGFIGGSSLLGAGIGKLATTGAGAKATAYVAVGEAIAGILTGIATGFMALDMHFIKVGMKNFADTVKELQSIPDIKDASAIKDKVKNAIAVFNELSDMFNGDGTEISPQGEARQESGVKGLDIFRTWGISNLAKALKSLISMVDSMEKLSDVQISEKAYLNVQRLAFGMKRVAMSLGSFASGTGFTEMLSSTFIKTTMTNVADELIQLRRMAYHINALAEVTLSPKAIANAGTIVAHMVGLAKQIGRGFGGVSAMVSSAMIKGTMKNVVSEIYQLRRMAYHINALAGTTVNVDGFKEMIAQIKEALDELKSYEEDFTLDITVKLSPNFNKSVKDTVKQIKDGAKKIKNAAKDLKNMNVSATIPVTINASVRISNAIAAIRRGAGAVASTAQEVISQYSVTGGMVFRGGGGAIYRAKGGTIPFKRRGTDTVPAMLTPGEYVHNKRAVDTFGLDFMRKVNNLDVKGAMNELMHRAGGMANINRGVSVTNNNYNNQKVTINNSNNAGAGFTFKSASRFVGAF